MTAPDLSTLRQRVQTCTTDQDVANYQRDGAVCIRNLFTPDEVELLKSGIEANLAQPSPRGMVASRPDDPGRFFEDFCNWQDIPQYKRFIFDTPLAALAQRLMQSTTVRLYHDHLLVKEPGTRQRTPWHQDQPYYNVDGLQNISFWIPVDPVTRASTLEFIAGSHRGPWLMPRTFMTNQAKWFPEGSLAELPNIENHREDFPILGWDLQPGDLACFHMLSLHASAGVDGTNRRRVYSVRFLGDDMTHAPRPWVTSPPFPGLDQELPAGAPMDHALFPLMAV
ncbi:phytanoyl-CoA dioxygenase family protein [Limnohabitans sp. T6-20]|uniref:phytanoyl-CoA dioxygenase family protein n=1 Tax=Limnohabitans sp. T6-20 TaxID=1100725 RepID=UPI000D3676AE|nr:phytanoyl-CoA dioxygenase family protein [Limnohabitans sp. T6-20]PUE09842.1 phytanoyl-CoA dioxygenase [Limnohabitans sp. T6-20]